MCALCVCAKSRFLGTGDEAEAPCTLNLENQRNEYIFAVLLHLLLALNNYSPRSLEARTAKTSDDH